MTSRTFLALTSITDAVGGRPASHLQTQSVPRRRLVRSLEERYAFNREVSVHMGYRVRNEHGELRFESFTELKEAWQQQLLGPEDEVLEDGSTSWQKAGSLPKLVQFTRERPATMSPELRWYLLAGFVVAVGAALLWGLARGPEGFAIVFGVALFLTSLFMWGAYRRKRR